ncbi:hypothetical protein T08_12242 [Trichinella sp. T8]|nr:hypothetical protein T08_12242 [Trichinella sp. T8]
MVKKYSKYDNYATLTFTNNAVFMEKKKKKFFLKDFVQTHMYRKMIEK